jgi:hypothetical protein
MKIPLNNVRRFFDFCNERHAIYLRRKRGDAWPWTEDKILQTYKFTNVYRELDAGTVWLREHIREPYKDHPELFFNIAMYRRYNRIECAEFLGFIDNYTEDYEAHVEEYKRKGGRVFTSAYMTCAGIRDEDGTLSKSKVHQIFGIGFNKLWEKRREIEPTLNDNLESAFNKFLAAKIPSFGPFIIYEVISDLRWTRYLQHANDIMTWANPGPGAARGIGRILGYEVKWTKNSSMTYDQFVKQRSEYASRDMQLWFMQYLLDNSEKYLADWMMPMEMRDIEHSLCEFDKYERVRLGEGAPKQKFIRPEFR